MKRTSLATSASRYCVLDVNLAPQVAARLAVELDSAAGLKKVQQWLKQTATIAPQAFTGIIADPSYSWPVVSPLPRQNGTVLVLNTPSLEVDPLALPHLLPDWNVESVAQNYAMAGLELWYHPAEPEALVKKQLVAELSDFCNQEDIDLLLWLRFYNYQDATASTMAEQLLQAVQELRATCQLLVLDFPVDSLTAATLTAELDIPWLVYLGAQPYGQAKDILRQALESGAAGCVVGEVLWIDQDPAADPSKMATEIHDRALELSRIVQEHAFTTQGSLTWTPT